MTPAALEVEPDPEAEEEDRRGGERPRSARRRSALAPRRPKPTHSPRAEEVRQHRIDERHAPEDLAAVEERERHGEAEQHEQIEVRTESGRRRSASPRRKTRQNASQTYGSQQRLAAERALAAARHLPGDLRPRPRLGHAPGRVLDHRLRDLSRLSRPGLDEPGPRLGGSPRRSWGRAGSGRARPRSSDRERELDRLVLVEARQVVRRPARRRSTGRASEKAANAATTISVEVRTTRAYCRRSSPA